MNLVTETRLLKPVAKATVPARTKSFNVAEFYQDRTGLCVFHTLKDRFDLGAKKTVDSTPERPYVASLLKAYACDRDIRKELPETHLSTLEDIAALIEAQPRAQPGLLLNNGKPNIFYIEGKNNEVFAMSIFGRPCYRCWHISVRQIKEDVGRRRRDSQVLYPGNAEL